MTASRDDAAHEAHNTHKGRGHWWLQRATAVALVPLTLWFVTQILNHIGDGYQAALAWVAQPAVAAAMIVYLAFVFVHSQLGLQVILEDYISTVRVRAKAVLAVKVINALAAAGAMFAVLRIAL